MIYICHCIRASTIQIVLDCNVCKKAANAIALSLTRFAETKPCYANTFLQSQSTSKNQAKGPFVPSHHTRSSGDGRQAGGGRQILVRIAELIAHVPQRAVLLQSLPSRPAAAAAAAQRAAPPEATAALLSPEAHAIQQFVHVLPVALGLDAARVGHGHVREAQAEEGAREVQPEGGRGTHGLLEGQERVREEYGRGVGQHRHGPERPAADVGGEHFRRDEPREGAVRQRVPGNDARAPHQRQSLLGRGVARVDGPRGRIEEFRLEAGGEGNDQEQEGGGDEPHPAQEEVPPPDRVDLPNDEGRDEEFYRTEYDRCDEKRLRVILRGRPVEQLGEYFGREIQDVDVPAELLRHGEESGDDRLAPVVRDGGVLVGKVGRSRAVLEISCRLVLRRSILSLLALALALVQLQVGRFLDGPLPLRDPSERELRLLLPPHLVEPHGTLWHPDHQAPLQDGDQSGEAEHEPPPFPVGDVHGDEVGGYVREEKSQGDAGLVARHQGAPMMLRADFGQVRHVRQGRYRHGDAHDRPAAQHRAVAGGARQDDRPDQEGDVGVHYRRPPPESVAHPPPDERAEDAPHVQERYDRLGLRRRQVERFGQGGEGARDDSQVVPEEDPPEAGHDRGLHEEGGDPGAVVDVAGRHGLGRFGGDGAGQYQQIAPLVNGAANGYFRSSRRADGVSGFV
mmetsp:Transcript_52003/g.156066  ORF Transcript_52003/g.156066 Transcript_52003/m.156066 type:complete len:680 (-) Transcript_52003:145-2184(-)